MKDFYNDHTILSDCIIALILCFFTALSFYIPIESLSVSMIATFLMADFMLFMKLIFDLCDCL